MSLSNYYTIGTLGFIDLPSTNEKITVRIEKNEKLRANKQCCFQQCEEIPYSDFVINGEDIYFVTTCKLHYPCFKKYIKETYFKTNTFIEKILFYLSKRWKCNL